MKHARKDYDRIQDPLDRIPYEEPVFLLRGQDYCALEAMDAWIVAAIERGASEELVQAAREQKQAMIDWQSTHGGKVPDLPEE